MSRGDTNKSVVAVSRFEELTPEAYERAAENAIGLLGAHRFAELVRSRRVVLKPNWVNPMPPKEAIATHPYAVRAMALLCRRAGAGEVILAESSSRAPIEYVMRSECVGMADLMPELPFLRVLDFSEDEKGEVAVPKPLALRRWLMPRTLRDAVLISIPKMKTHALARATLGIKNIGMGCTPGADYCWSFADSDAWFREGLMKTGGDPYRMMSEGRSDRSHVMPGLTYPCYAWRNMKFKLHYQALLGWHEIQGKKPYRGNLRNLDSDAMYADIAHVAGLHRGLTVVDAGQALEGNGPSYTPPSWGGKLSYPVDMRERAGSYLLVAGFDPVATDTISSMIMGWTEEELPIDGPQAIRFAAEKGVGTCDPDRIVVRGVSSLEEVTAKPAFYRPPYTLNHNEEQAKAMNLPIPYPPE